MASITAHRIDGTDFLSAVPSRETDLLDPWFRPTGFQNLGTGAYLPVYPWSYGAGLLPFATASVDGVDVSKYFAEIDFRYTGDVIQAVGLFIGQNQSSIDLGNWDYGSPLMAASLGINNATDFWFEIGQDGDGLCSGVSDTAYGAAAGSGIATLRIELLDEYATFLLNGQLLHTGMRRQTPQGPFFGIHASDMGVITAFRYGFEAAGPVPDFWQDFVITTEIQ